MDDAEIGACVRRLITAWLDWHTGVDRRERAAELVDRVEGYRIVDGGQIDRDGTWEITDAETGELLARGTGLKSFDEAWQDSWAHVDSIGDRAHQDAEEPGGDFGLPPGLASAIRDWVVDQPDEARQVLSQM